ncbi:transglycosylase SLT domain-containing protein [Aeromonas jandaei]|uniref:transglycosylase SLT domain-containing protein n=1 Tax=Aeromonas jandaei TaxID=650 RepID=UPI001ABF82F8|nr:transglycosylase SLT domain-containing protein [Aeromonas jandaei]
MTMMSSGNPLANCWQAAGDRHNIDPLLLYAIAEVESSLNPRSINYNNDGSTDIGLMQINSRHLPQLAKQGITQEKLLNDVCVSIHTGASVLAGFIRKFGYSWQAVGAYNAGGAAAREPLRQKYAEKVWMRYKSLVQWRKDQQYKSARE